MHSKNILPVWPGSTAVHSLNFKNITNPWFASCLLGVLDWLDSWGILPLNFYLFLLKALPERSIRLKNKTKHRKAQNRHVPPQDRRASLLLFTILHKGFCENLHFKAIREMHNSQPVVLLSLAEVSEDPGQSRTHMVLKSISSDNSVWLQKYIFKTKRISRVKYINSPKEVKRSY